LVGVFVVSEGTGTAGPCGREFGFEDNLRDIGLTSLDMTSLVFAVEADFAIEIPDRAITPANFTSVTSIGDLVRTLRPGQPRLPSGTTELSSPAPLQRLDPRRDEVVKPSAGLGWRLRRSQLIAEDRVVDRLRLPARPNLSRSRRNTASSVCKLGLRPVRSA
jgi:Phosphopantetheine attachment site